jgi:folate-binding protein YgfZ
MMIEPWQTYLQQHGAQFEDHVVGHFGSPELERQAALQSNICADLSYFGVIKVSGSDAAKFLQGQLTNDVWQVNADQSQLTAWCNPKGRVIANLWLFKRQEAYYLCLPQANVAMMLKRLQMYVLRAAVQLTDVSQQLIRLGIAGEQSTALIADNLKCIPPTTVNASLTLDATTMIRIQGSLPRYLLFTETPQALWQSLAQAARPVGTAIWQWLDIMAGLPQIIPATSEEFIPQMINYALIGGVSFKKGCYTGQEIVARTQHLGTLKRRMYLARIDTTSLPQPGDALYVNNEPQSVGKIVNAQWHPHGGVVVLAVIQITHVEQDEIYWPTPNGDQLQWLDLPDAITT